MENYYTTLGLTKSASIADVTASFRKLALKHHPDRNPEDQLASKAKLDQICESYDVLSNPMYRAVFDQHGKRGLNSAVADGKGGNVKGTGNYKFGMHGDSDAIFMRVFGTDNPFAELYQVSKDFFDPNYVEPVPCIVRVDIECSLEEFFAGGIKVVPVDIPGAGTFDVTITVLCGWTAGTELCMSAREIAGVSCPKEHYTTQCIFTMRQAAHSCFEREGDDLITHPLSVPLVQALTGYTANITMLDGHQIPVGVSEVISNDFTKLLPGQGMPTHGDPSVRGDLVLRFKVVFPVQLNDSQKHLIKSGLYLPNEGKQNTEQQDALRGMRRAFQFN